MARFDWYECTTHWADADQVVRALCLSNPALGIRPGRPMHGYERGVELHCGPDVLATVWWGGNPGVHVKASSDRSPWLAGIMREVDGRHAVTRADVCEDWVREGLFDEMAGKLLAYAKRNRIAINQQGDWERGMARTLYLGSPTSECRLVLYEKGFEAGYGSPFWVRLEARVKAKRRDVRERIASLSPSAVMGFGWLRKCLVECLFWEHIPAESLGGRRSSGDVERSRRAVVHQYGAVLRAWAEDLGGVEKVGPAIMALADQIEREEQSLRDIVRGKVGQAREQALAALDAP